MTTIHAILDDLARTATDARDKGDRFEQLMAAYLRTDPLYKDQYSNVWLWADWPGREGRAGMRIDCVAEEDEDWVCTTRAKPHDLPHAAYRRHARDPAAIAPKQHASRSIVLLPAYSPRSPGLGNNRAVC